MRAGRLAGLAVLLYFGGVLAWLAYDARAERAALDEAGSTFHRGPSGTSLAFGLLAERAAAHGGRVERLTRPIVEGEAPRNGIVFRIEFEEGLPEATEEPAKKKDAEPKPGDAQKADDKKSPSQGPEAKKSDSKSKPSEASDSDESDENESDENESDEEVGGPVPLLTQDEEAWIRGGGRFVLATSYGGEGLAVEPQSPGRIAKVLPLWQGVEKLRPAVPRSLAGRSLTEIPSVFLLGDQPLVVRVSVGRGELIVLACPEIWSNARLGLGDHVALLLALAEQTAADSSDRPIFFDERWHGFGRQSGPLALLGAWGLAPALLLGLVAAVIAAWRAGARLGPPERDDPDLRSDAVDLVDALGELYRRALNGRAALALYRTSLVQSLAVDHSLGIDDAKRAFDREVEGDAPAPQLVVFDSDDSTRLADLSSVELAYELARLHRALETFDARKSNRLFRPA